MPVLVMLRRVLPAAVLLLLLSARAQAEPIDLLFTFDHYEPIGGPRVTGIHFTFFQSATNGWPGAITPEPFLAEGGAALPVGVTHTNVTIDANGLGNVYFSAYGSYVSGPDSFISLFAAAPPSGPVWGALPLGYGPPWISLRNLGSNGISGELQFFYGYDYGPMGTWALTSLSPVTPVPEPASLLLFGSGLAAVAANRYRKAKRGR